MELHSNKLNGFKEKFHKLRGAFQGNNSLTKHNQSIFSLHIRNLISLDDVSEKQFLLFLQVIMRRKT